MTTQSSTSSPEDRPEIALPGTYYGNPIPYLPIQNYPGKIIAIEGTDGVGLHSFPTRRSSDLDRKSVV